MTLSFSPKSPSDQIDSHQEPLILCLRYTYLELRMFYHR